MIDTHCHLTFGQLRDRVDEVIGDAVADGVDRMICVGTTTEDSLAAREVARQYDNVWFTVGIHPHYAAEVGGYEFSRWGELVEDEKFVGFGEMGIDYHYDEPSRECQRECLAAQLEVVRELDGEGEGRGGL